MKIALLPILARNLMRNNKGDIMSEKLDRFVDLLRNIFELDKSDLDFGIYRIMNIRKAEIDKFLSEKLPLEVRNILEPVADNKEEIQKKMSELKTQAERFKVDVEKDKEYQALKEQLLSSSDLSALETDVYSSLYNFFNRYYEEGDFISKRRYKEGVYAIPYEGEEVKLTWANQDQYYIKTTENFKDYSFISDGITVHFMLVDATTEQNNNKEDSKRKRAFMLFTENEDQPDIKTFEYKDNTFIIRFIYEISEEKPKFHEERNYKAINEYISSSGGKITNLIVPTIQTPKGEDISPMQKHLNSYVAKNTFDYFIHKDLGGFLNRELDFFIKSEIIRLDDIDTEREEHVGKYLTKVRAIKRVGKLIIDFLAQIENFQKRLWLKKKFVIRTDYCITLDRIDEEYYQEIANNKTQVQEWVDLYAINEASSSGELSLTAKWSNPPTVEFLKENKNLVIDTKHFSLLFRDKIIASIENLDEAINGILVHSENFQALNILQERYKGKIDCIYIDPPYNAKSSEILYKNNYKHSSWISLMHDRIKIASILKSEKGVVITAIDENEAFNLMKLYDSLFSDWVKTVVTIMHNPAGVQGDNFSYSHEYAIFLFQNYKHIIGKTEKEEKSTEPFRDWGPTGTRNPHGNTFYPIHVDLEGKTILGFGDACNSNFHPATQNIRKDTYLEVYPVDDEGNERKWVFARDTVESIAEDLYPVSNDGTIQIFRIKSKGSHKTVWTDKKYYANIYGSKLLNNIMGLKKFDFPKSIHTVEDCINAVNNTRENITIILDFFAGSGTTGHAVINLNRNNKENCNKKYILVEMGEYFNIVTKPRMQKVIYSNEWKDGKPQNRNTGISQLMKYFRLESYEDTLSNIEFTDNKSLDFGDDYLIHYMLDSETKDSLLNIENFKEPFDYRLKITERNEIKETVIDLVETFNYLIGLNVVKNYQQGFYKAVENNNKEYEGSVDLKEDKNGVYTFKQLEGDLNDETQVLIIWRNITDNLLESNAALDAFFTKTRINAGYSNFNVVYVNGDNNLENLRDENESWKVEIIEKTFIEKMFEA